MILLIGSNVGYEATIISKLGDTVIAIEEDIEMKKLHAANYMHDKDYKGLFRCGKCRGYKTTFYQMQTRSADEPMTVFITCHTCNIRWKS